MAAAIGMQVITPEPTFGSGPMVAIARADCPPDCGGGPGNGGTPSGPPGGGTGFVPPSMPAMPSYEPGRGQPPLDQNNGISIYNSTAPQPSQAAQPSQQPVQNQDGSYSRAANGEQQPVNYNNAPNNQQPSNDWRNLSNQLNQQQSQQTRPQQQDNQSGDRNDDARKCAQSMAEAEDSRPVLNMAEFLEVGKEGGWDPIKTSGRITTKIAPVSDSAAAASGLSRQELTGIVQEAMGHLNEVSNAKFVDYQGSAGKPDLTVSFEDLGVLNSKGEEIDTAWYIPSRYSTRNYNSDVNAAGNTDEPGRSQDYNEVRLNTSRLSDISGDHDRMVQAVMHEMMHGLGLDHSCAHTVMNDDGNPLVGAPWFAPLDLAALRFVQGKPR
ncbi:hypothetical protein [Mycobacteroides salmoniphilum]|uniref:hypothetical protein n=1 Tax=Mycobacteroides salmoniphilum TaxID=404941 RepID=UPI001F2D57C4|nr:hypothetical protein [Mycobacteroides salmoniphilum]